MPGLTRGLAALMLAVGVLILGVQDARAEAEVDLALVLAVEVSLSTEPNEQEPQRQGFIEAFRPPEIHETIHNGLLGRIAVTYLEGAGWELPLRSERNHSHSTLVQSCRQSPP